ncbi:hypothetical protein QVD17_11953 [Tagetes erecta]|uniref:Uncharacterized protein n=1 Tax=Tagetes erecta TaxID=13708 RepID=A0AAD8NVF2_TARER|nr:hypothetical protein QVD17_11953 [Tagetes erecta]
MNKNIKNHGEGIDNHHCKYLHRRRLTTLRRPHLQRQVKSITTAGRRFQHCSLNFVAGGLILDSKIRFEVVRKDITASGDVVVSNPNRYYIFVKDVGVLQEHFDTPNCSVKCLGGRNILLSFHNHAIAVNFMDNLKHGRSASIVCKEDDGLSSSPALAPTPDFHLEFERSGVERLDISWGTILAAKDFEGGCFPEIHVHAVFKKSKSPNGPTMKLTPHLV